MQGGPSKLSHRLHEKKINFPSSFYLSVDRAHSLFYFLKTISHLVSMPNKILVLFAHPAFHKSRINKILIQSVQRLPDVTFHDLYEAYPELDIDSKAEQRLLLKHDIFVFHHPMYWYSTPAILKEWQDLVLEHGWAYGSTGTALQGKKWMHLLTTGGRSEAYQQGAFNRFTIREFLRPLEQTAVLCKMDFIPPYIVDGTHLMTEQEAMAHGEIYRRLLESMASDRFDWSSAASLEKLNHEIDRLIQT